MEDDPLDKVGPFAGYALTQGGTGMEKLDLTNMFLDAMSNYWAGWTLTERSRNEDARWFIMPSIILTALSLEIFFKLLIIDSKNTYGRIHELNELWPLIDADKQNRIRAYATPLLIQTAQKNDADFAKYGITGMEHPSDFDECLELSSYAFEKLRYMYEWPKQKHREGWHAGPIVWAAAKVVLDLHPEWKNWRGAPRFQP